MTKIYITWFLATAAATRVAVCFTHLAHLHLCITSVLACIPCQDRMSTLQTPPPGNLGWSSAVRRSAGVLPELQRFSTSRSCCAFFPAPAGKLEWLTLRLWSYWKKICNTIGHILDIVCCNTIMFCKIVTKYLFLLANFGPWSETVKQPEPDPEPELKNRSLHSTRLITYFLSSDVVNFRLFLFKW